jgi:hypothetical protein
MTAKTLYQVTANDIIVGTYAAETAAEACRLAAQDVGYESEEDMEDQLGEPSDLEAREIEIA